MHDHCGAFAAATGRQLEAAGRDKPRYRRYQYELIAPHCGRSVLEVGAGLGEFAEQFDDLDRLVRDRCRPGCRRGDGAPVRRASRGGGPASSSWGNRRISSDPSPRWSRSTCSSTSTTTPVRCGRWPRPSRSAAASSSGSPATSSCTASSTAGSGMSAAIRRALSPEVVRRAGLDVELVKPVNLLGGVAWWLAVRRGGATSPNPRMVAAFDRCVVPVTKALERVVRVPFGQSVLCVARKRGEA